MGTLQTYRANGHAASGYLAIPEGSRGPGILVIQEWWGLVDHIKSVADRFAAAGFVALAPDFYHGQVTDSPDTAAKLFMALNIDRAAADLRGSADFLLGRPEVAGARVGALGFCMGGQLALYAGMVCSEQIGAVVDFYGIHPNVRIDPARLAVPVLGHFARRDSSVPVAAAEALATSVIAAGGRFDAHFYDADHAFFNDTRPAVFHQESAALAWDRSVAFLRRHLG